MTPQPLLVILSGGPAAGKSTYAAQLRVGREDIAYIRGKLEHEERARAI